MRRIFTLFVVSAMLVVATAGGAFADSFQVKNNMHSVNNANNSTGNQQITCQGAQLAATCNLIFPF